LVFPPPPPQESGDDYKPLDVTSYHKDQQTWQAPPYQPGSGAGAEAPDLGRAEREAMEKSSLIYVRNVSANSASAQAREIHDPAPELGLGLATGTRLRALLESAASTAVRTPPTN